MMDSTKSFKLMELFTSIKGEGINTGIPMAFIRFAGCNLQCPFCDTPHEVPNLTMGEDDILTWVREVMPAWIVLTGGEPGLSLTMSLMRRLSALALLAVETNGTVWNEAFTLATHVAMSPKPPAKPAPEWARRPIEEVRFLIDPAIHNVDWWDTEVGLWLSVQTSPVLSFQHLTFSPLFKGGHGALTGTVDKDALELATSLAFRFRNKGGRVSVQVHKLLGVR